MEESIRNQKMRYIKNKSSYDFYDLVLIVELLRSEGGCPWDIEQTHKSIRKDFIEETYEVIEAIDTDNPALLKEELGDVLLQTVFHARIEEEAGSFDIGSVTDGICKKLIHRHPHVFGGIKVDGSEEVLSNWDKIKSEEKGRVTYTDKLNAIPPMLPALMRAQKVGKKAACFDFESTDAVILKIYEETEEVKKAIEAENHDQTEEEIGDLLLTVTSLARKAGVDSEEALYKATNKFISRFERLEEEVAKSGRKIDEMNIKELDEVWDAIKHT